MSFPTTRRPDSDIFLYGEIEDISTAGQIYIPCPDKGKVIKIFSCINGAIGTANAILTAKINGVAVTGGTITVAYSGSAAGDVDSCEPSANHRIEEGEAIEIETGGQSTNTVKCFICVVVRR